VPQKRQNKPLVLPFTVDLISDLNLESADDFTWDGCATSLFCVVAGNVARELSVVEQALTTLSRCYRGVFYIDGSLEHENILDYEHRIDTIRDMIKRIGGVIYLHSHVVILNNVAFMAINGWHGNHNYTTEDETRLADGLRDLDIAYLTSTITGLQQHPEAKQIVVISSSIPSKHLTFGDPNLVIPDTFEPILGLHADTSQKVTNWMFGGYPNLIEQDLQNRRYCNNPQIVKGVCQPKQIVI